MDLLAKFRHCAALLAVAAVGGCFDDPYATALSELDLADTAAVADLAASLAPEDRGMFKTYALRHSAQTRFACGNIERHHHGKQPETVAEALDFTRKWEQEDARRRAALVEPDLGKMSPKDRYEYELEQLRVVYREVADRQANMIAARVPRDSDSWKKSEADMQLAVARIDEKLAQRP